MDELFFIPDEFTIDRSLTTQPDVVVYNTDSSGRFIHLRIGKGNGVRLTVEQADELAALLQEAAEALRKAHATE